MNDACLCSCKCNAIKELNTWGVTGTIDNHHWRELVAQFCGFLPPDDEDSKKISKQLNPI
jgi:chemotaxis regulatin CheY-phosphate phosphatase CheZ